MPASKKLVYIELVCYNVDIGSLFDFSTEKDSVQPTHSMEVTTSKERLGFCKMRESEKISSGKEFKMDERGFIEFMQNAKRSQSTIQRYTTFIKLFEDFLTDRKKSLDEASPGDFRSFLAVVKPKYRKFSFVSSIRDYYAFTTNDRMRYALDELDYQRPQPYKLTRHIAVNPEYVKLLAALGITTSRELVQAGKTKQDRKRLSEKTGILYEDVLELVKLSDLSRKWGPKRARLYYDAGYDTFDKVAAMDPAEFRERVKEYIRIADIDFTPPTPKEAHSAVEGAKRRPRIVED